MNKTQFKANTPLPSRNKRNEAKRKYKEDKKAIELARKELRLFSDDYPADFADNVCDWAKAKGIQILSVFDNPKDKGLKTVLMAAKQPIEPNSFVLGKQAAEWKHKSIVLAYEAEKAKIALADNQRAQSDFELTLDNATARNFYERMKDVLKITARTASFDGRTKLTFDFSEFNGTQERERRITQIYDAYMSIKSGLTVAGDYANLEKMIKDLEGIAVNTKRVFYKRVTGQYLIDNGIANVFDSRSKASKGFQKVLNWLFGKKRKFDYIYNNELVNPEKQYIIEVDETCQPTPLNHEAEIIMRYEFGEMEYRGKGLKLAYNYYTSIVEIYNSSIE